jgi:hypothetical protein
LKYTVTGLVSFFGFVTLWFAQKVKMILCTLILVMLGLIPDALLFHKVNKCRLSADIKIRRVIFNGLHGILPHNIELLMITAVLRNCRNETKMSISCKELLFTLIKFYSILEGRVVQEQYQGANIKITLSC